MPGQDVVQAPGLGCPQRLTGPGRTDWPTASTGANRQSWFEWPPPWAFAGGSAHLAVSALYQDHRLGLTRLAILLVDDEETASDVVQDAFAGLYQRWDRLADPTKEQQQANRANVTLSSDVLFSFNSARLSPAATHILAGVAKQINSRATGTVSVVGYTDSIGSTSYNLALSRRRAAAVVARIAPLIHGVTLRPSGRGEADPVAANRNADGTDNPAGRAQNRRVTLTYSLKPLSTPATKKRTAATPHIAGRPGRTVTFSTYAGGISTDTYRLRVNSLRRDGDLSVLQMKLTCVASTEDQTCQSSWDFTRDPTYEDALNYFNGFQLYDPTAGTTYLVAGNSATTYGFEETPTPLTTDTNYELMAGERTGVGVLRQPAGQFEDHLRTDPIGTSHRRCPHQ